MNLALGNAPQTLPHGKCVFQAPVDLWFEPWLERCCSWAFIHSGFLSLGCDYLAIPSFFHTAGGTSCQPRDLLVAHFKGLGGERLCPRKTAEQLLIPPVSCRCFHRFKWYPGGRAAG